MSVAVIIPLTAAALFDDALRVVSFHGRAILSAEDDGTYTLYGVQPACIVGVGHSKAEAISSFRGSFEILLQEIAIESATLADFNSKLLDLLAEIADLDEWREATFLGQV